MAEIIDTWIYAFCNREEKKPLVAILEPGFIPGSVTYSEASSLASVESFYLKANSQSFRKTS